MECYLQKLTIEGDEQEIGGFIESKIKDFDNFAQGVFEELNRKYPESATDMHLLDLERVYPFDEENGYFNPFMTVQAVVSSIKRENNKTVLKIQSDGYPITLWLKYISPVFPELTFDLRAYTYIRDDIIDRDYRYVDHDTKITCYYLTIKNGEVISERNTIEALDGDENVIDVVDKDDLVSQGVLRKVEPIGKIRKRNIAED